MTGPPAVRIRSVGDRPIEPGNDHRIEPMDFATWLKREGVTKDVAAQESA
jgi:hypothetical protein